MSHATTVEHSSATLAWAVMTALTLVTFFWGTDGHAGGMLVIPALLIVLVKGRLLLDHFMEVRGVRRFWRLLLGGYLWTVVAGIGAAFLVP